MTSPDNARNYESTILRTGLVNMDNSSLAVGCFEKIGTLAQVGLLLLNDTLDTIGLLIYFGFFENGLNPQSVILLTDAGNRKNCIVDHHPLCPVDTRKKFRTRRAARTGSPGQR